MDIFSIGIITLLITTAVFYVVLFSFIFYWHLKKITYVVVPAIFTFEFLATGFLVVVIITLILQYVPEIVKFANTITL